MKQSLAGQFLISAKHLRDSNFFKTVVLMIEHGDKGAMGLVINRPSSILVSSALEEHFDLPDTGDHVYIGGPVEPQSLFVLHNFRELEGTESPIVSGLFVGSSAEAFETVVQRAIAGHEGLKFRIFAGCAGWAPRQLDGELSRGDWLVAPATLDFVFHEDPYAVWDLLLKAISVAPHIAPGAQGNPEWN